MRVLRRGRHVTVTPALRQHIEDRRRRLERYGVDPGDVEVVLNVEKHRHTAEATLTVNGKVIQAKVPTSEMDHSVDQLHANISRQVRKRKEKLVSRRQRGPRSRPVLTSSEPPSLVLKRHVSYCRN